MNLTRNLQLCLTVACVAICAPNPAACQAQTASNTSAAPASDAEPAPLAPKSARPAKPVKAAEAAPATPEADPSQPDLTSKNPLLLALIIKPIIGSIGTNAASSVGNLFKSLTGQAAGDAAAKKSEATAATADKGTGSKDGHGDKSTSTPDSGAPLVAAIAYSLEQLDPKTFAVIKKLDMTQDKPTLRTGEVFAIELSTNLPGQVRIDNVDESGTVSAQGTYNVLPGRDNRIPRTKGIRLEGGAGLETFKTYFAPCIPAEAKSLPEMAYFQGKLLECAPTTHERLAQASKGVVRSKSATNLEMPDTSVAMSAVENVKDGEIVSNQFSVNHVAP